ncbi:MAG: GPW/gp25 family protein [Caldilineaceae bacterium]|nr:GPW/gp25 family protein [Caldilineaceae bacterium]
MAENVRNREFIGQGLNWPLQLNAQGSVAMTQGEAEIEQSIRIILETIPGERVMRPEFGCRVWELMFAPRDANTEAQLVEYVQQALRMWEPRIDVTAVEIVRNQGYDESVILADIHYRIKNTHDERSIVYPFYIMDEPPTVEDF